MIQYLHWNYIYVIYFDVCAFYLFVQNLIDLAGSESSKAETTGVRRKEGSYINKSLLTLGTVRPHLFPLNYQCSTVHIFPNTCQICIMSPNLMLLDDFCFVDFFHAGL